MAEQGMERRAVKIGAIVAVVTAALLALMFVFEPLRKPPQAAPIGLSSYLNGAKALDFALAPSQFGPGYPDGKGHALFWAYGSHIDAQGKPEDFVSGIHLVRMPDAVKVATVSGADSVFWLPGGTAVAEVIEHSWGVPILQRLPFIGNLPGIGPRSYAEFYELDLEHQSARRLPKDKEPKVHSAPGSFGTMILDLPETRERGNMVVTHVTITDGNTGKSTQFIELADIKAGATRRIFEREGATPVVGGAMFVDDDTILFTLGDTVWQVKISTGKAEQVWPPPEAAEGRGVESRK